MTIKEFMKYVKDYNIPEDYEIEMGYDSEGDYNYGYQTVGTEDYIRDINDKKHTITIGAYLTTY